MSDNAELLKRMSLGDASARDELISSNMGLVHSIARRFLNRGYDMEDIEQIGALGLIKAVDRFDISHEVQFSTYAVPLIMGEIRKFLRDDGPVKVSRGLKELARRAAIEQERFESLYHRKMTIKELSASLGVEMDRLLLSLEAAQGVTSIYESTDPQGEEFLLDRLASKGASEEETVEHMALSDGLKHLDKREKTVILLRYFRDMTQSHIATYLGVSQVQVSRIEQRARDKLKRFVR